MHQSFVNTAPRPGGGQGIAIEMCCVCPHSAMEMPGIYVI